MIEYTLIVSYKTSKYYYTSPRVMKYDIWYDCTRPITKKV